MHDKAPAFYKDAFNCPHCSAFAAMSWEELQLPKTLFRDKTSSGIHIARCHSCKATSIWTGVLHAAPIVLAPLQPPPANNCSEATVLTAAETEKSIQLYPAISLAPMPSPDLPENCRDDYMEARDIFTRSPRAAAALLRLVVQKLCKHFGEPGRDINQDIGRLVDKGLPRPLQQALDTVRVIGNEAVHPGELDLNDSPEVVAALFKLVNLIVEKMITEPKQIAELYQTLPEKKLQGIEQRDKPKP